jgi:hypothetical protein
MREQFSFWPQRGPEFRQPKFQEQYLLLMDADGYDVSREGREEAKAALMTTATPSTCRGRVVPL